MTSEVLHLVCKERKRIGTESWEESGVVASGKDAPRALSRGSTATDLGRSLNLPVPPFSVL